MLLLLCSLGQYTSGTVPCSCLSSYFPYNVCAWWPLSLSSRRTSSFCSFSFDAAYFLSLLPEIVKLTFSNPLFLCWKYEDKIHLCVSKKCDENNKRNMTTKIPLCFQLPVSGRPRLQLSFSCLIHHWSFRPKFRLYSFCCLYILYSKLTTQFCCWRSRPGFWFQFLHSCQPLLRLVGWSVRGEWAWLEEVASCLSHSPAPTLQPHHSTLAIHW